MSNCCIRGAITVDYNTREDILENTIIMLQEIIAQNQLQIEDIVSILFTATKDLDAVYPAVAARQLGIVNASLMCAQELYIENSLKMCVRAQVTIETDKKQKDMKFVYLKGATKLRPDLVKKQAIAIDGPAGSGKSTVAKLIAKELNFVYVDTGAMYRAVGLYCFKNQIDVNNTQAVVQQLDNIKIDLKFDNNKQIIFLNGIDVTEDIRSQQVAEYASAVAKISQVREALITIQREIGKTENIVMDGRDIGTNVLPNADVKVYLDADVAERAKRRCNELAEKNLEHNFYKVLDEIIKRDKQDKERDVNPLTVAEDAVVIDTTNLEINAVKEKIIKLIKG